MAGNRSSLKHRVSPPRAAYSGPREGQTEPPPSLSQHTEAPRLQPAPWHPRREPGEEGKKPKDQISAASAPSLLNSRLCWFTFAQGRSFGYLLNASEY